MATSSNVTGGGCITGAAKSANGEPRRVAICGECAPTVLAEGNGGGIRFEHSHSQQEIDPSRRSGFVVFLRSQNNRSVHRHAAHKDLQFPFRNHELREAALQANWHFWKDPHNWLVKALKPREVNSNLTVEHTLTV